jgi:3-phenylpropionate/trans-cinnamate dioxygenase ferredoxin reductase component
MLRPRGGRVRDDPQDAMSTGTFVIVGGGLAGAKAAGTLRAEGFEGRVVLLGEEPVNPYERPPLSKDYLRGESGREAIWAQPEDFYAGNDVELRTGVRATALHPAAAEVEIEGGERIAFDMLLLATGASPNRLPVPGADLPGVRLLRTVADSDALRDALRRASRAVVIGAGWIGCEVAASARQMGVEVAMVAPEQVPLERVLGAEVGAIYGEVHASRGVELVLGTGVEAIEGTSRATGVRVAGGRVLEADLVVVGVGISPRVELAQAAGLRVDDGILVDDRLRTSAPNVFAAGDVARAQHPLFGETLRIEHWHNALEQGPAAARNMLGRDEPYDRVPYFFSDQYDVGMEYAGYARSWERVVFRGDPASREFVAFWMRGDRVLAGMNVNVWDVTDDVQALVRSGVGVDDAALRDPDTPLSELVITGSG